jgi:hypothetical protein
MKKDDEYEAMKKLALKQFRSGQSPAVRHL